MISYDDWKLETPEDGYARQNGHPCLCPECSENWEEDVYGQCVCCGAKLLNVRDPDDAREAARDDARDDARWES